jgi:hypothetical protein
MTVKLLIITLVKVSSFTIHEALVSLSNNVQQVQLPLVALAYNSDHYELYNDLAYLSSLELINENLTVYLLTEDNSHQHLKSNTPHDLSDGVLFVALIRKPIDPLLAQISRVFNPRLIIIIATPRVSSLYPGRSMSSN